jgi:hypothetical protein
MSHLDGVRIAKVRRAERRANFLVLAAIATFLAACTSWAG